MFFRPQFKQIREKAPTFDIFLAVDLITVAKSPPKFTKALENCLKIWYTVLCTNIYPWHSWIARQTPTLKVNGSNPFG